MKAAGTLMCMAAALLGVTILQNTVVDGGKSEYEKQLFAEWSDPNRNIIDGDDASLKKKPGVNECPAELTGRYYDLKDLLEVMQYVVVDSLDNREFRSFVTKRFLHNFVPQASKYMKKIQSLKRKINPYGADEDAGTNIAVD